MLGDGFPSIRPCQVDWDCNGRGTTATRFVITVQQRRPFRPGSRLRHGAGASAAFALHETATTNTSKLRYAPFSATGYRPLQRQRRRRPTCPMQRDHRWYAARALIQSAGDTHVRPQQTTGVQILVAQPDPELANLRANNRQSRFAVKRPTTNATPAVIITALSGRSAAQSRKRSITSPAFA